MPVQEGQIRSSHSIPCDPTVNITNNVSLGTFRFVFVFVGVVSFFFLFSWIGVATRSCAEKESQRGKTAWTNGVAINRYKRDAMRSNLLAQSDMTRINHPCLSCSTCCLT